MRRGRRCALCKQPMRKEDRRERWKLMPHGTVAVFAHRRCWDVLDADGAWVPNSLEKVKW
jgi:hypothetical protein